MQGGKASQPMGNKPQRTSDEGFGGGRRLLAQLAHHRVIAADELIRELSTQRRVQTGSISQTLA